MFIRGFISLCLAVLLLGVPAPAQAAGLHPRSVCATPRPPHRSADRRKPSDALRLWQPKKGIFWAACQ